MANQEQKNTFDVIDELVQILKSSKLIEDRIIEVCRNLKSERDNLKIKLEELENKTGPFIKAIESAEYAQMKEDLDGISIDETKKKWLLEALGTFKATGATFDALTGVYESLNGEKPCPHLLVRLLEDMLVKVSNEELFYVADTSFYLNIQLQMGDAFEIDE